MVLLVSKALQAGWNAVWRGVVRCGEVRCGSMKYCQHRALVGSITAREDDLELGIVLLRILSTDAILLKRQEAVIWTQEDSILHI